jgi:fermentation-respiration switch protein FrsA (DUF1100 family)
MTGANTPTSQRRPPVRFRYVLVVALVVLAALYAAAVGALFLLQRSAIYFPPTDALGEPAKPIQTVTLHTADGETLSAWYAPPTKGRPVILFFHGNASTLTFELERWRRISAAGVGFLAVNYRGYPGSTGHPTEEGLHQDALAAYRWLEARYPPSDIVIQGHSLGAGVAVRLAAEKPSRALILEAPFTSAVDRGKATMPWAPVGLLMRDRYPSRDRIGGVRAPVLIVHGDRDAVIPFSDGQALFAAARQPKAFVRIPGGGHNDLVGSGLYDHVWPFLGLTAPPTERGATP